jgi:predicted nucleic acid-binding protein
MTLRTPLNLLCVGITIGLFLIVSCWNRGIVKKDSQILKQLKIEAYFKNANENIRGTGNYLV